MRALFDIPAGAYTRADVMAAAWSIYARGIQEFLCSTYSDVKVPRHDQRYKFNREAEAEARKIIKAKGFDGIRADREKHRARLRVRVAIEQAPRNILAAPLVVDYLQNRDNLREVCADRLVFYGRNHWAKNERDRRLLSILAPAFARYQETRTA